MCKKLLSLVMVLVMLCGAFAVSSFANEGEESVPAGVVIADFSVKADIDKAGLVADGENKIFAEKSGTLSNARLSAESVAMTPINLEENSLPTDWSNFTHYNLWVYSAEVTTDRKFAVVIRSSASTSSNTAVYYVNQDFEGWKKLSIPLSSFTKGANFDMTQLKDTYVSFVYGNLKVGSGKAGEWNKDLYKKVSYAKMWLTTETETNYFKELYNSHSTSSTKNIFNKTNYAVISGEASENNDQSLKLTGTGENACESKNPTFDAQDFTEFDYINFRVKNSDASAPGSFNFYMTITGSSATATAGYWSKKNITVQGDSWTTVSLKIPSDFKFEKNSSTPTIYSEMSHIEGLRFDYINGTMYVEKIWLSYEIANDDYFELYSSDSSSATKVKFNKTNYVWLDSDVKNENTQSLCFTGDGTTSGSDSSESKRYGFDGAQNWTRYNYINFLVLNANKDADNNTIDSSFRMSLTINGTNANSTNGMWYKDNITVSGSEWKVVSVELSKFRQAYNGEITDGDKYSEMNNIEGMFFDGINGLFHIEKIWLSESDDISAFRLETASVQNDSAISSLTRKIDLTYTLPVSDVKSVNVYPETDFLTDINDKTISIIFPDGLKANTQYTVSIGGISDIYLIEDSKSFELSFSTEACNIEKSDSGITARYTFDTENAVLIIAVYNEDGSLKSCTADKAVLSDGTISANINYAEVSEGQSAKLFVWDGFININPFAAPVIFK